MEYELSILDRVVLVQLFMDAPKIGSRLFYTEFDRVSKAISIEQPEQEAIGLKFENEQAHWNKDAPDKTVDIPECIEKMIIDQFKKWDQAEQLLPGHIPVYDKFVKEASNG